MILQYHFYISRLIYYTKYFKLKLDIILFMDHIWETNMGELPHINSQVEKFPSSYNKNKLQKRK